MNVRGPWTVDVLEAGGARAATARLLDDALLLGHGLGVLMVELATIDGVEAAPDRLTLHRHDVAPLVIATPQAAALARAVVDAATGVPELTAALRALGSPRARPGSDHDAWFGPLLAARRAAHAGASLAERLAAFNAAALLVAAHAALDAFASARHAANSPDARALAEELREHAAPLALALRRLAALRSAVEHSGDAARLAECRAWVAGLRDVFAAADGAWEAMLPALADSQGRSGSLWRRVLRRGRAAP